ncbi:MAG TPA: transcriptional repressor LexA [bacterium]|nr:transcriptional repressor LexA [bacterium]
MERTLTKRQEKILSFIRDFLGETGYSPTVREIARHFGFGGPRAAQKHLAALEKKGYVTRTAKRSRTVRPAAETESPAGIPIVGTAAAGRPVLAEEHIEGAFSLPVSRDDRKHFFVRVKGESMIDAHIADGDLVMVRQGPAARGGDIVVAMLDNEITIKRFFKNNDGSVTLRPENRSMRPITVKGGDLRIIGKVIMVVRQIGS